MLPRACLPIVQRILRNLPRGGHRLVPFLERNFALEEIETASLIDGQTMKVRSRDVLQRQFFWFGAYEKDTTELLTSLIQSGMTVLDIGANVGYFTLVAARCVGPAGRVIAFEPVPDNHALLEENVSLNDRQNVTVERLAVSDSNSFVKMFLYRKDVNSGMASMLGEEENSSVATCQVQTCSIDSYLADHGITQAHIVKIDVQGGEGKVLDGMMEMMGHETGPSIIWELNPSVLASYGDSTDRLIKTLSDKGYKSFLIGSKKLTSIKPNASDNLPEACMVLSVKSEKGLPQAWKLEE